MIRYLLCFDHNVPDLVLVTTHYIQLSRVTIFYGSHSYLL